MNGSERVSDRSVVDREVFVHKESGIALCIAGLDGEAPAVGAGAGEASPLDEAAATESVSRAIEDQEVFLLQLEDGVLR